MMAEGVCSICHINENINATKSITTNSSAFHETNNPKEAFQSVSVRVHSV